MQSRLQQINTFKYKFKTEALNKALYMNCSLILSHLISAVLSTAASFRLLLLKINHRIMLPRQNGMNADKWLRVI